MAKKRNSGIELLRIIAMLMVIVYHWVWHGGIRTFSDMDFGVNVVFMQFLLTLGRTGCCIFAIITGYFMIGSKRENYYPKIISISAATHLYYLLILIIVAVTKVIPVTLTMTVRYLLPMIFGPWYVITYVMMLFLLPFLNPWLQGLSKSAYAKLVVISLVIWSAIPTATADSWEFSNIDFFLVMYLLGGYLRLHPIEHKLPWGWMAVGSWLLMLLSVIGVDLAGLVTNHRGMLDKAYYFGKINSVLAVILTVTTFMWFSKRDFYSSVINLFGSATLGIYLLHNNYFMRVWLFQKIFPNADYVTHPYLNVLIKTAAIFFVFAAVEIVRAKTVGKWFDSAVEKRLSERKSAS